MNRLFEWLCDLDRIRLAGEKPLTIQWHAPFPRWAMFGLALVMAALVAWTYRREPGGVVRRTCLAAVRAAVIALVFALLCQPVLVAQHDRVERGQVQILVDGSSSMQQTDRYVDPMLDDAARRAAGLEFGDDTSGAPRIELARTALTTNGGAPLRVLARTNDVRVASFASAVVPQVSMIAGEGLAEAVEAVRQINADGSATNLTSALNEVLANVELSRLAAIVVLSDGQSTDAGSVAGVVEKARARRVPIHVVPIGSPQKRCDLSLGRLVADGNVFAGDLLTIRAEVIARGLQERRDLHVELYDERRGVLVESCSLTLGDGQDRTEIELNAEAPGPGRISLRVGIVPIEGEFNLENNVARCDVPVLDQSLRVLYVEGYPRYEYRYLKNAFVREKSILLSCLLLSADADFAQEGTEPIRRFPESAAEMQEFDVIIFGDVDPRGSWLTEAQAQMVADFVGRQGGGFALIAGERHAPQAFRDTPLEPVLPIRIDPDIQGPYGSVMKQGFQPRLTPEGERSPIFRFRRDLSESVALFHALPPLYWMAGTRGPKPGAEVLCARRPVESGSADAPLVVVGRYGAGRTFFQATDDTWRWRRHTGELVFDMYWVQVARSLAQQKRLGEDQRVVLRPDPPVCRYGERVNVGMRVFDTQLLARMGERTELTLRDPNGFVIQRVGLESLGSESAAFEGSFVPIRPGRYSLIADDVPPLPASRPPQAELQVELADLEADRTHADHQLLRTLADGSGGDVIPVDALDAAFARVEDRSLRIPDDISEPIWDSKLALILFTALISAEWVIRKLYGML